MNKLKKKAITLGVKLELFLLLCIYLIIFAKVNIFKLIGITIILKSLFVLLNLLNFSNYIFFIYFFIYGCFIYGIYICIKKKSNKNIKNLIFHIILKFLFLFLFWDLLSEVSLFLDLPLYFKTIIIPTLFKFESLFKFTHSEDSPVNSVGASDGNGSHNEPTKPTEPTKPSGPNGLVEDNLSSKIKVEGKESISPENFNLAIDKLFYAIGLEFSRYHKLCYAHVLDNPVSVTDYAIKWEDLFYWLKVSSLSSEEDIEKLSILLEKKDYNEFFTQIPRFLKYNEDFLKYYILNGNVYLSEYYFDFFYDTDNKGEIKLDKSEFILVPFTKANISNYKGNTSLTMFLEEEFIPTINESADMPEQLSNVSLTVEKMTDLDTESQKYIYFMSISDLFDSNIQLKTDINVINNDLISNSNLDLGKCKNFWQFDYYNKWYYYWFIELDIQSFVSLNILRKLGFSWIDITPDKLMYSTHLTVIEYSEELDILMKAKIWYEHYTGIKYSSLPDNTLNEYKNLFIKFWIRQIFNFCKPSNISSGRYITNMYDDSVVYLELLENILFAQSKILEAQWTINNIHVYLPSFIESKEIDPDTKLINFYNNLFTLFKKEIVDNYKDVYDLRRAYKINMFHCDTPLSCEDLDFNYNWINRALRTDAPMNIELASKFKKK